jgi:hypothetical protein
VRIFRPLQQRFHGRLGAGRCGWRELCFPAPFFSPAGQRHDLACSVLATLALGAAQVGYLVGLGGDMRSVVTDAVYRPRWVSHAADLQGGGTSHECSVQSCPQGC